MTAAVSSMDSSVIGIYLTFVSQVEIYLSMSKRTHALQNCTQFVFPPWQVDCKPFLHCLHSPVNEDTLFFIFVGVQLLYYVVLVSAVQQSKSVICIHMSTLFQISFPFRSPENSEQSFLSYTVGSHQLPILYIIVHICQ